MPCRDGVGLHMLAASAGASLSAECPQPSEESRGKAMLKFLFPRLTADAERGAAAFDAASGVARQPDWYREGVPDTIDGRFAVLATIVAILLVRLEQCGEEGQDASVALTERFIAVMEAEHRELGLGDPSLGKTVRRLVGSLARRNALWREAISGERTWDDATAASLRLDSAQAATRAHCAAALRDIWHGLAERPVADIEKGVVA